MVSLRVVKTSEDLADLADLLEQRVPLFEDFVRRVAGLADLAAELGDLERRENALRGRLGPSHRRVGSPPSELLVEVLHGRLSALRPHLPVVSEAAAARADAALVGRGGGD